MYLPAGDSKTMSSYGVIMAAPTNWLGMGIPGVSGNDPADSTSDDEVLVFTEGTLVVNLFGGHMGLHMFDEPSLVPDG